MKSKRYYNLKSKNICVSCGRNKTKDAILCDDCKKIIREREKGNIPKKQKLPYKRLPRLCKDCGLRFQPLGKFQKYCNDCNIKRHRQKYIKVKKEVE